MLERTRDLIPKIASVRARPRSVGIACAPPIRSELAPSSWRHVLRAHVLRAHVLRAKAGARADPGIDLSDGTSARPSPAHAADRVVLLTRDCDVGRIAASTLAARFPGLAVIVEDPVSRWSLLRGRVKRLGLLHVTGQLAFMIFQRVQQRAAGARIAQIADAKGLNARWPLDRSPIRVRSVNAPECTEHLRRLDPRVILVVGTRIIGKKVLGAFDVPFVNYHAGITPKYRGAHGGYWAKVTGDAANFGVTVHLIDPGIDTGDVLYQARLTPSAQDNYSTFPYLQLAAALPLLERAACDAIAGRLVAQKVDLPSGLWSHPTLWGYVWSGLRQGAW
jgi:folate-dependent phosphoribosylglycinamide formyltransferase PurN